MSVEMSVDRTAVSMEPHEGLLDEAMEYAPDETEQDETGAGSGGSASEVYPSDSSEGAEEDENEAYEEETAAEDPPETEVETGPEDPRTEPEGSSPMLMLGRQDFRRFSSRQPARTILSDEDEDEDGSDGEEAYGFDGSDGTESDGDEWPSESEEDVAWNSRSSTKKGSSKQGSTNQKGSTRKKRPSPPARSSRAPAVPRPRRSRIVSDSEASSSDASYSGEDDDEDEGYARPVKAAPFTGEIALPDPTLRDGTCEKRLFVFYPTVFIVESIWGQRPSNSAKECNEYLVKWRGGEPQGLHMGIARLSVCFSPAQAGELSWEFG